MLTTLLALTFFASPADDYFVLVPGTRRTYEERGASGKATSVDEVGEPVNVAGKPATPVITKSGDQVISTTYYRSEPTGIYMVGTSTDHPLPKPIPMLMFDVAGSRWTFNGSTSDAKLADYLTLTCEAVSKGERTILGRKVPVIELKMVSIIDRGLARGREDTTAIYAKGIGLVESVSKHKERNKEVKDELRLIKFEEAKPRD
ncbi:hypothetical protein [Fimbriimonas ginsengisoli]|uniref:Uncharacterized protein n=1 Tax=Fimbriimonas ginsengisoli Gsoil 348 TaxID=661478 RepID=A0A068NUH7_FIMGI|nr:hypothetical protein [Fimbriimonas ginsengisoli]AIE86430.1 hypothetical protein OP10G_3062 [Fimbriimonas ginsengisoli Gsoil 348]